MERKPIWELNSRVPTAARKLQESDWLKVTGWCKVGFLRGCERIYVNEVDGICPLTELFSQRTEMIVLVFPFSNEKYIGWGLLMVVVNSAQCAVMQ